MENVALNGSFAANAGGGGSRACGIFERLRTSLARAADGPLELSHTERAIRLAEMLRAELLGASR